MAVSKISSRPSRDQNQPTALDNSNRGFNRDYYPWANSKFDPRTTEAYKIAYKLFVNLTDQSWFNRLEALVSGYAVAEDSFWQDISGSNSQSVQMRDNFNKIISDIQNLIAEYYKYQSELPLTQVQNFDDAGINSAITGQNISSSGISPVENTPVQHSVGESESLTPIVSTIGTIASAVTSFGSVYSAIAGIANAKRGLDIQDKQLSMSESEFSQSMWKSLVDDGFDVSDTPFNSYQDISNWMSVSIKDPKITEKLHNSRLGSVLAKMKYSPFDKFYIDQPNFGVDLQSVYESIFNTSDWNVIDQGFNLYTQYIAESELLKLVYDHNTAKFNADYSNAIDGELAGDAYNAQHNADILSKDYEGYQAELKKNFINNFAETYNSTKDPASKYALLQTLFSLDLDEQSAMELLSKVGSPTAVKAMNGVAKSFSNILESLAKAL